ncbi:MAG: 5'/3'-nucleotidase SurE [Muribaculaceae bacterium]|nr:5'/3'-nucleotidase SurE [Muribaculaceae bacterium]
MSDKKIILITNDDSIEARGIHFLVDCVKDMGDVYVVAPESPQSGQSSAMSVNKPLRIKEIAGYASAKAFTVNGTPVDCVKLALHAILPRRPDILLSGINHGSNAGNCIIYSGTMGAVLETCMLGIPSIGYSYLSHSPSADFTYTKPYIELITREVINNGLPKDICLNVNFPKGELKGLKVLRAAHGHWSEEYKEYIDPHGKPFYWLTGAFVNEEPDADDTDHYWLSRSYVSVVPSRPDQSAIDTIPEISEKLEKA